MYYVCITVNSVFRCNVSEDTLCTSYCSAIFVPAPPQQHIRTLKKVDIVRLFYVNIEACSNRCYLLVVLVNSMRFQVSLSSLLTACWHYAQKRASKRFIMISLDAKDYF